jgi:hypothetical protein
MNFWKWGEKERAKDAGKWKVDLDQNIDKIQGDIFRPLLPRKSALQIQDSEHPIISLITFLSFLFSR